MKVHKKFDYRNTAVVACGGASNNQQPMLSADVTATAKVTDAYTFNAINEANPLNNPTPFQNVPDDLKGSGETSKVSPD